jgi:cysteine synthase
VTIDHFTARASVLPNAAAAIGATPLVELRQLSQGKGLILAKLELLNPGFSKKDRAALQIVSDAEHNGSLRQGQTVVELTSGNMGTGLAIVCTCKGYPFVAVMSRGNSIERALQMRALGAEVVLVDQALGSRAGEVSGDDLALVEQAAQRITVERNAFRADQFHHRGNFRAHYLGTGQELWIQSSGHIDAFCDFVGSGGSLGGITVALKEHNPSIRCYAVEPTGCAVLAGEDTSQIAHPIQGGGYAISDLEHLRDVPLDGFVQITGDEAKDAASKLARYEGIFGGYSSGANLAAALKLLDGDLKGATIAITICDSGLKYLSTDLWN